MEKTGETEVTKEIYQTSGIEEDGYEEEVFSTEFNARLQNIKDLLDGKLKSISINKQIDDNVEELFLIELKNLKNKLITQNNVILKYDEFEEDNTNTDDNKEEEENESLIDDVNTLKISEDSDIYKNDPCTKQRLQPNMVFKSYDLPSNETNSQNLQSSYLSDSKWYNGTYYQCKPCGNHFWEKEHFQKHLKNTHRIKRLRGQYLTHSSKFEELKYNCNICNTSVNHGRKSIQQHLKKKHGWTIQDYEDSEAKNHDQFKTNKELKKDSTTTQFIDESISKENKRKTQIVPKPAAKQTLRSIDQNPQADTMQLPLHNSYRCPLAPCSFSCSKQGMREQQGALHLLQEHAVRHEDMLRAGGLRFTKIRGQQ